MIDTLHLPCPLQSPVLEIGPDPAHLLDLDAAGFCRVEYAGLGREAPGFQFAGRGQNVSVMVALIALAVRRVDRHIDGHAVSADQLLGEVAGDLGPVFGADL